MGTSVHQNHSSKFTGDAFFMVIEAYLHEQKCFTHPSTHHRGRFWKQKIVRCELHTQTNFT